MIYLEKYSGADFKDRTLRLYGSGLRAEYSLPKTP